MFSHNESYLREPKIRVDTYVETKDGMRKPINRAYATVVALDENDKPTPVPRLIIEGPSQQMEWEGAKSAGSGSSSNLRFRSIRL